MSGHERDHRREHDAATWIARLQSRSVSTHDLADFARWRRDPLNAQAYERAEQFWEESSALSRDPDMAKLIETTLQRPPRGFPRRQWIGAIVSGALAVMVALVLLLRPATEPGAVASYATVKGERSILSLEDGTRVQLDTDSQISTALSPRRREVSLKKGRVNFDVSHDAKRPFTVDVDGLVTVTAHGTKFDVFRQGEAVDVVLYQGVVDVRSRANGTIVRLAPGQAVHFDGGALSRPQAARVREAASWQVGHVTFNNTPLSAAVAEFNRYTNRPLSLSNSTTGRDAVSGEFSTDDVDGFIAATDAIYGQGTVMRTGKAE